MSYPGSARMGTATLRPPGPFSGACFACGEERWLGSPVLGRQSMVSDGQIVGRGLHRVTCLACGLGRHENPPRSEDLRQLFETGYGLYAHAPGGERESRRQSAYARWILDELGTNTPENVLEIGCGNGSLLRELAAVWPQTDLAGVEPSAEAVEQARSAGIAVTLGFAEDPAQAIAARDLVISINVIEHASDPLAFLRAVRLCLRPGGKAVIVCPDGHRPSLELLFFDHLHSFTLQSFERLLAQARLRMRHSAAAPTEIGPFRMFIVEAGHGFASALQQDDSAVLAESRARYLSAWAGLDGSLLGRLGGAESLSCFGAGETAFLLRAYAPETWARVRRIIVHDPVCSVFAGVRVIAPLEWERQPRDPILLAVRPQDQDRLYGYLARRFSNIVRWDDLVAA